MNVIPTAIRCNKLIIIGDCCGAGCTGDTLYGTQYNDSSVLIIMVLPALNDINAINKVLIPAFNL